MRMGYLDGKSSGREAMEDTYHGGIIEYVYDEQDGAGSYGCW